MRIFKPLLITLAFLLFFAGGGFSYLFHSGYFSDPQIALRELKKQEIAPTATNVRKAASEGQLPILQLLARSGADFSEPDEQGRTPLHLALAGPHLATIEVLRDQNYDLDARDHQGNTPLSMALALQEHALATRFIEEGASPNFTLPNGELALPGYHQTKRINDVAFLLENGANPNSPSSDGHTTLALALQSGQADLTCQLIQKGANPNSLVFGEPVLVAVLKDWKKWRLEPDAAMKIIGSLLVSGAEPEQPGSNGLRPLQIALDTDFRPSLELLFPRVKNVSNSLWFAINNNNIAAIENLLSMGSPVEEIGPTGDTPLLHAIRHHNPKLITSLLSAGADPDQFCNEGQRALFLALALENNDVIHNLLAHENRPDLSVLMEETVSEEFRSLFGKTKKSQLDWYCRNETGINPLMFAVLIKNLAAAERLLELGMDKVQGTASPGVVYPIQMAAKNGDVKMQQLLIGVSYRDEDQVRKFVIDLSDQKVTYYENGEVKKTSRISSGRSGYRTPTGNFVITDKTRHKKSNIYSGSPMPYFRRFSCKAIGFHEGNTYSRYASHGCIRLPRSTAQFFWKVGQEGDRVTIQK